MKKKVFILLAAILIAVMPFTAAYAGANGFEGKIYFNYDGDWDISENGSYVKLKLGNEKGLMLKTAYIRGTDTTAEMAYIALGPECAGEYADFKDIKGAERFMDEYGYNIAEAYFDKLYQDNCYIEEAIYGRTGVIQGTEWNFARVELKNDEYPDERSNIYIAPVRDNIYCMFYADGWFGYEALNEHALNNKYEKEVEELESIVGNFEDIGLIEKFARRADKKSIGERLPVIEGSSEIESLIYAVLSAILLVILIIAVKKLKGRGRRITFSKGDKKKTTKTVDGKVTTTVHCTYEDSLRSLRDSGILTQKEYREMLDKHNR